MIRMAQQADNHEKQKKWTFMMRDWAKFTAKKKGREWRKETSTYNKVINFDVQLWTICEDISDHVACWVEVCYYFSTQFAAVKNMEKTL